jgi:uncharacterized membrane protein
VTRPNKRRGWTDRQVEQTIGTLLRLGLIVAAVVVLCGAVVYLARHGSEQPQYRVFHGEPADLRGISGIIHDALQFSSRGLIQFGLLLLLATPVARVSFSIVAFALQRDRLYVVVTSIVLGVLLYSIIGGYLP